MEKRQDGTEFKLRLNDIMRAQYVSRWHIVNMAKQQSVAEHSFNVVMIARRLLEVMDKTEYCSVVTEMCLFHDLDELVLGDIPTPSKYRYKLDGVTFPDSSLVDWDTVPRDIYLIVKIADFLDAIHFIDDNGVGRHAKAAREHLEMAYRSYKINNLTSEQMDIVKKVEVELFSRGFVI